MSKKAEGLLWVIIVVAVCGLSLVALATRSIATNAEPANGADAASTFNSKCAKCHGHDGRGKTMRGKLTHARDLTDASWQSDVSDERLFNSISNGKGKMPSFKKKLSDSDIDGLVAYVRRLRR